MNNETLSVTLQAPKSAVFYYLTDIDNFPEWANEFCLNFKNQGENFMFVSPLGKLYLRIQAEEKTGEIKFFATEQPNGEAFLLTKVTQISDSSCEYMIDFSKPESITELQYQQQRNAIKKELSNIKNNFSNPY